MPIEPSSTVLLGGGGGFVGQKFPFLLIDDVLTGEQVGLQRRQTRFFGHELVTKDHDQVKRDAQITGDEIRGVEGLTAFATLDMHEDVKVLEDGNHDAEHQGEVGAVEAEGSDVVHLILVDALRPAGFDKVDVRHENGYPGQEAEDGDQIDKIEKHFPWVASHVEKGNAGDGGRETQGVDRNSAAIRPGKNAVTIAFFGQSIQRAGSNVQVAVGGRENKNEDTGVNESRERVNAAQFDGDNKWRSWGAGWRIFICKTESFAIIRDESANQKDGENVEDYNTPEGEFNSSRNHFPRVLSFANRNSNELRSEQSALSWFPLNGIRTPGKQT